MGASASSLAATCTPSASEVLWVSRGGDHGPAAPHSPELLCPCMSPWMVSIPTLGWQHTRTQCRVGCAGGNGQAHGDPHPRAAHLHHLETSAPNPGDLHHPQPRQEPSLALCSPGSSTERWTTAIKPSPEPQPGGVAAVEGKRMCTPNLCSSPDPASKAQAPRRAAESQDAARLGNSMEERWERLIQGSSVLWVLLIAANCSFCNIISI